MLTPEPVLLANFFLMTPDLGGGQRGWGRSKSGALIFSLILCCYLNVIQLSYFVYLISKQYKLNLCFVQDLWIICAFF